MASCAILVPSLGRGHVLKSLVANIKATTPEEHRIYFCVGDELSRLALDDLGEQYIWDGEEADKRYVTRMNKLVKDVVEDDIFFGSDDVVHHEGWLTSARSVMDSGYPVVVVNDLSNPNGTQALMATSNLPHAVFDDPEAAFHHGYLHNFADTEMFLHARMQGKLARAMDSVVAHLHPGGHKTFFDNPHELRPHDSTYQNAQNNWEQDAALFNARARQLQVKYG